MERLTEYHCGVAVIKDKDRLSEAMAKLARYEDLEESCGMVNIPCKLGDIVYDIVTCEDGNTDIIPMKVCCIVPHGQLRKGIVWNLYLEDSYTKAYHSIYDIGKTIFLSREEADKKLDELYKSYITR